MLECERSSVCTASDHPRARPAVIRTSQPAPSRAGARMRIHSERRRVRSKSGRAPGAAGPRCDRFLFEPALGGDGGLGRGQSSPLIEAVDPVAAHCRVLTAGVGRMTGGADVHRQLRGGRAGCERRSARRAADIDEMQVWMTSHEFSFKRYRGTNALTYINAWSSPTVPQSFTRIAKVGADPRRSRCRSPRWLTQPCWAG
jgi:hypothetical protein